tara:strand:- start:937 stop:1086 length:150 start_codon:yes stop_codon:yes gene_type:complete
MVLDAANNRTKIKLIFFTFFVLVYSGEAMNRLKFLGIYVSPKSVANGSS